MIRPWQCLMPAFICDLCDMDFARRMNQYPAEALRGSREAESRIDCLEEEYSEFGMKMVSLNIMQSIFSPAARRTILEQNGKLSAATVGAKCSALAAPVRICAGGAG